MMPPAPPPRPPHSTNPGQRLRELGLAQKGLEIAGYDRQFAAIRTELAILKFLICTNVAISLTLLWRVFSH